MPLPRESQRAMEEEQQEQAPSRLERGEHFRKQEVPLFWHHEGHLFREEYHSEYVNQGLAVFSLERFPLVEDFEVRLVNQKLFGYHVEFFSQKRGLLAHFAYWDHAERDLCKDDFTIPCEYDDVDQGWELLILEDGSYIYILEGDLDHHEEGYYTWFKVEKACYLAQWQTTINTCRHMQHEQKTRGTPSPKKRFSQLLSSLLHTFTERRDNE